jgi:hypothetical protein
MGRMVVMALRGHLKRTSTMTASMARASRRKSIVFAREDVSSASKLGSALERSSLFLLLDSRMLPPEWASYGVGEWL